MLLFYEAHLSNQYIVHLLKIQFEKNNKITTHVWAISRYTEWQKKLFCCVPVQVYNCNTLDDTIQDNRIKYLESLRVLRCLGH